MDGMRTYSGQSVRRGILKNVVVPASEAYKTTDVDLSGRHLERLPTSLFSSLHLTSINLSHNLLTPAAAPATRKRLTKRRRDRRRRQPNPECRESSRAKSRASAEEQHEGKNKSAVAEDEAPSDTLSGDSGLPPEPPDEEPLREDVHPGVGDDECTQDTVNHSKKALNQSSKPKAQIKKDIPEWVNITDELQAKLRLRRAISEGKLLVTGESSTAENNEKNTSNFHKKRADKSQPPVIPVANKSSKETDVHAECEERALNSEDDDSSSSCVDESDSAAETAGGGGSRGGVRALAHRSLGGLDNLKHFQQLQEVILSYNGLQEVPGCLLSLPRLTCLTLSHNHLQVLPNALKSLTRLVELDVSHNQLLGLGAGVAGLPSLGFLTAAHNRITTASELANMDTLTSLDLSGNRLSEVPGLRMVEGQDATSYSEGEVLRDAPAPYIHQGRDTEPLALNLRLNDLTGPVTLASIQNVTELDVSDNGITSLDVSCLASLTDLTCSNNAITSLTLHAGSLVSLTASNNRLNRLEVRYHPRRLARLNLSRNELSAVPPWLVSSTEVTLVDVSHNNLTTLPAFLTSGHLRRLHTLSAHHNHLSTFLVPQRALSEPHNNHSYPNIAHSSSSTPYRSKHQSQEQAQAQSSSVNPNEEPKWCSLEVLLLHHNRLASLPSCLFTWLSRLRVLNVSANQLSALPSPEGRRGRGSPDARDETGPQISFPLQEVYAAANRLRDLTPLQHCRALRILHAPYNRIASLQDRLVWSWELLEELVLSGNVLTNVPAGVSRLRRLRVLKVHSNPLRSLPRLAHLSALKVVDASHCQLGRVELEELVSPGLVALDISANTALSLDHHQFTKCKSRRPVNVVDVTSRSGRSLPLTKPHASQHASSQDPSLRGKTDGFPKLPWTLGFAETIGRDSKLTVGQLRVPDIAGEGRVGVAALADGGQEVGCVGSLLTALPALLQEERACSRSHTYALKYALLTALRRLRSQGAPLPGAVCAAHLELEGMESNRCPVLRLCCYGAVSAAVTTTHGEPIFVTTSSPRTQQNCVRSCDDGVKCALGEPVTLPDPHTTELYLGPHHTAVVIGSSSFWEVIGADEVTNVCSEMSDPGKAAKRLLDLAQGYGTRQALSVIVVRLLPMHHRWQSHSTVESVQLNSSRSRSKSVEFLSGDSALHRRNSVDEDTLGHRVQLNRKTTAVDVSTSTTENDDHRRKLRSNSHSKKGSIPPLRNDTNKSRVVSAILKTKSRSERNLVENIEDLDRSSPSGQSQSDHSEHDSDIQNHSARAKAPEPIVPPKPRALRPNLEDLYAKPNRRKRETGNKNDLGSKADSAKTNSVQQAVTYYHYPRPDPTQPSPQNHLASHLLGMSRTELDDGVLAPPAGFADTGSDSEDSDSGLSGVSGGHQHASNMQHAHSEDNILGNDPEQVTEEQFRSWEYLLARNAKLLFMRELDTLTRSNSRCSQLPTASAPDLVTATAAETDATTHFQRNPIRKSRLGRGTFRLIQSKLSATTSKFSTLQRFRSNSSKNESNFRRFGSLQNLKYYQQNRPRPSHYPLVQPDLATEMQERQALDSLELETRMHHYWHTGVTNF
ncbi:uncharacterized protein LOC122242676 isoform X2 [Penaeus japonicus]|uniref:uncharacterized protein LOC122242676 isoform X2 n=1 Tax=Penaeus japonicus TaxID=27405 RepID=UPI001C7167CA|nr:uncharacterized protein LOC122242676 isoform X2 [Penaeus japonicus]